MSCLKMFDLDFCVVNDHGSNMQLAFNFLSAVKAVFLLAKREKKLSTMYLTKQWTIAQIIPCVSQS